MRIGSIKHKGLKRLVEEDDATGLPSAVVDKIRDMFIFLEVMSSEGPATLETASVDW